MKVPYNFSRHSDPIHPFAKHAITGRHAGHDLHAGHFLTAFRDKFWWTLAFTIPVVVWSADVQLWLGYTAPSFAGSKWIPSIFGTIVFAYGESFFSGAHWVNWPTANLA